MRSFISLLFVISLVGCTEPEPRKPVKIKTGSFIQNSVERNLELLAQEEKVIQEHMAKDSLQSYLTSATGSWYYYETKIEEGDYLPQPDDLIILTYNVLSLQKDTIYSKEDIGIIQYKVDKQEMFPGLRNSVKLLKEGETAIFLFPSSMAFGYHGDNNKIEPNQPIMSSISILKIEKQKDSILN